MSDEAEGGKGAGPSRARGRAGARARAVGTQDWVQGRIEAGDIEGGLAANQSGTSIFDPVLCELAYRWFCPPGGLVLDPFAGGSVRGIVASMLGRRYLGIDLSKAQIEANRAQAKAIGCKPAPKWRVGDSREALKSMAASMAPDFIFTCPPYADLERYSDDERDLSTMAYPDFLAAFREIIAAACARLADDRFAGIVVGDVRDEDGLYYGFPWHTIQAFEDAGMRLYNEAILVTAAGSLPIRMERQFRQSRKLGKTHQNFLVFVKGDPRAATEAIGEVEAGPFDEPDEPGPENPQVQESESQAGEPSVEERFGKPITEADIPKLGGEI